MSQRQTVEDQPSELKTTQLSIELKTQADIRRNKEEEKEPESPLVPQTSNPTKTMTVAEEG